jgi:hypothetical protein
MFMLKKKLWLNPAVLILPVLLAAALLSGCPMGTNDDDDGETWSSIPGLPNGWYKGAALPEYDDGYGIEGNVLTYYNDGAKDVAFAGTVESYAGDVAVIKITDGGSWNKTVGKYYGVYIGDVTGFSFTGSSAFKQGGNNDLDTLEAAVAEYTADSGYFEYKAGYGLYAGTATITGTASGLDVTWTAVPRAAGYDVYYTDDSAPPTSITTGITTGVTITNTTATITGITDLTPHNVWVRAKDAAHTGAWVYQGSGSPANFPAAGYFKGDYIPYDDGVGFTASHFYQYDDGGLGISFGGDIVKHIPIGDDGKAGTIIIKITEPGTWEKTAGNYYAVAYKAYGYNSTQQLTMIQSSSAYKTDGENNGVSTIAEAVTEYTAENGYFDNYGTYRQFRDTIPQTDGGLMLNGLAGGWSGTDGWEDDYFIRIANPVLTWATEIYSTAAPYQFAGTIVETTTAGDASGYIYIKLDYVNKRTQADYTTLEAGKYYAIHWKNKVGDGIDLCAAYSSDITGTETLAEAKSKFTVANDYFDDDSYVVIAPSP